jgi:hypothetical protein
MIGARKKNFSKGIRQNKWQETQRIARSVMISLFSDHEKIIQKL